MTSGGSGDSNIDGGKNVAVVAGLLKVILMVVAMAAVVAVVRLSRVTVVVTVVQWWCGRSDSIDGGEGGVDGG